MTNAGLQIVCDYLLRDGTAQGKSVLSVACFEKEKIERYEDALKAIVNYKYPDAGQSMPDIAREALIAQLIANQLFLLEIVTVPR